MRSGLRSGLPMISWSRGMPDGVVRWLNRASKMAGDRVAVERPARQWYRNLSRRDVAGDGIAVDQLKVHRV